jgi:hypothetical protein
MPSFKTFCLMQKPHVGKMVNPTNEIAKGVSSLQGTAAVATRQQAWHWALRTEQPSFSHFNPRQQKGERQGAPGLRQHSALQQQTPNYRWHRCNTSGTRNGVSEWIMFVDTRQIVKICICRRQDPKRWLSQLTLPLQPKQSQAGKTEQFTQHSAQQRMSCSSSMASSPPHMVNLSCLFGRKRKESLVEWPSCTSVVIVTLYWFIAIRDYLAICWRSWSISFPL